MLIARKIDHGEGSEFGKSELGGCSIEAPIRQLGIGHFGRTHQAFGINIPHADAKSENRAKAVVH